MAAQSFPQFVKLPLELRNLIWDAALPKSRVVTIQFKCFDPEAEYLRAWRKSLTVPSPPTDEHPSRIFFTHTQLRLTQFGFSSSRPFTQHCYGPCHSSKLSSPGLQTQLETYGFTSSHTQPPLPPHPREPIESPRNRKQYIIRSPTATPVLLKTCRESASYMRSQGWVYGLGTCVSKPVWINYKLDTLYIWATGSGQLSNTDVLDSPLSWFSPVDLRRVKHLAVYWRTPNFTARPLRRSCAQLRLLGHLDSYTLVIHDTHRRNTTPEMLSSGNDHSSASGNAALLEQVKEILASTHVGRYYWGMNYKTLVESISACLQTQRQEDESEGRETTETPGNIRLAAVVNSATGRWGARFPEYRERIACSEHRGNPWERSKKGWRNCEYQQRLWMTKETTMVYLPTDAASLKEPLNSP